MENIYKVVQYEEEETVQRQNPQREHYGQGNAYT